MSDESISPRTVAAHDPENTERLTFEEMIEGRLSVTRRKILQGGLSAVAAAFLGGPALLRSGEAKAAMQLGFNPVAKSLDDLVVVPEGYVAEVLYRLGDPIAAGTPAFANDGNDTDFHLRAGDHHDGMYYYGLNSFGKASLNSSSRGLLAINHENITQTYLHASGATNTAVGTLRPEAEAIKELHCHGVSVIEIKRNAGGQWSVVPNSKFNRRITPDTPAQFSGPVAGKASQKTKYDPTGRKTRGTINNCANGYTPWGTYLTCEENWAGYFRRKAGDNAARGGVTNRTVISLNRYGIPENAAGNNNWASIDTDRFQRWDCSVKAADATGDYRNEPNSFGWVVEINPYNPNGYVKKRTAMGRFAHEGAWPAPAQLGQPVVFYMGDDSRGEYIYKYVSQEAWIPVAYPGGTVSGDRYLDKGTVYVAKFNADGSGTWIPLIFGQNGLDHDSYPYPFENQADILTNTRLAADKVGATKMDRPEWATVFANGEVYFTLTNNSNRRISPTGSQQMVDAANPRDYKDDLGNTVGGGNINGHIIRFREADDVAHATSFTWDVYAFGAEADSDPDRVNLSGLDATNEFSSPDGLWVDPRPNSPMGDLLWIQTDDGAFTDESNCMMLAAIPGSVGDGGPVTVNGVTTYKGANPGSNLRRFLVGPKGCEITGIDSTPDGKTLFVNIQHPGETGTLATLQSSWPAMDGVSRPRSATIAIRRLDGGVVGVV